jgi:predicted metal-binding membrane protein
MGERPVVRVHRVTPGEDPAPVRDRVAVLTSVGLLVVAAGAWVSVVRSSLRGDDDMMMTMPMPATAADAFAFTVGWGIMMTAMMLPSALPMISLYAAMRRGAARGAAADGAAAGGPATGVPVATFTAVYLLVWAASGIPVYLAHTLLMALPGPAFAYGIAMILLAAGAFQLSPLKQACLRACRSPLGFLLGHWRAGRRGSLALGWSHAIYCLGCCWALMLVLVTAGAMGLRWVLLITAVVAVEKLLPGGEWIARAAGAAFLLLGVTMAVRPELAMVLRGAHAM